MVGLSQCRQFTNQCAIALTTASHSIRKLFRSLARGFMFVASWPMRVFFALLMVSGGSLWIDPLLEKMPYDVVRDFAPVTITNSSPLLLVLHPSVAAKSVKELIALAKAKPGALNFGSGGGASSAFLAGELFKA